MINEYFFVDIGMRVCEINCGKGGFYFFKYVVFSEYFNIIVCMRFVKYKDNILKFLLVSENVFVEEK